jgi:outer membrane protein assembly factor BamB
MAAIARTLLTGLVALVSSPLPAADWPAWRGSRADGTWVDAPSLPDKWPAAGPRKVWSIPIGGGYAGIAVADGRIYAIDREKLAGFKEPPRDRKKANDGDDLDGPPEGHERVLCLEAANGKLLWSHKYPARYGDLGGYANGPRAMPTVHDGRVYTLGAVGHFHCFDAKSGRVLWAKDLRKEHKARVPMWGLAASPVIHKQLVIVHVGAEPGGCVLAFDRVTGKEVWRSLDDPAGYCTPILADTPGQPTLIVWTPENINGIDPDSGKRFWSLPYKVTYGVSIATPIYRDGIAFISGYWEGSRAIRIGTAPTEHELAWEDRKQLCGLMAQPLYRSGHVYMIEKGRGLVCFDLKTGQRKWEDHAITPKARNPHASYVWLGNTDRILAVNSSCELILARLSPKGYAEESRVKLLDGEVWGHPAFARGHLYVRTDGAEGAVKAGPFELSCFELAESSGGR